MESSQSPLAHRSGRLPRWRAPAAIDLPVHCQPSLCARRLHPREGAPAQSQGWHVPPDGTDSVALCCSLLTTRGAAEAKPMAATASENLSSEERSCGGVGAGRKEGSGNPARGGAGTRRRRLGPESAEGKPPSRVPATPLAGAAAHRRAAPSPPRRPAPAGCGRRPYRTANAPQQACGIAQDRPLVRRRKRARRDKGRPYPDEASAAAARERAIIAIPH